MLGGSQIQIRIQKLPGPLQLGPPTPTSARIKVSMLSPGVEEATAAAVGSTEAAAAATSEKSNLQCLERKLAHSPPNTRRELP